jgi:hypothetical protein
MKSRCSIQKRVHQSPNDVGGVAAAAPHSGKRQEAHQVINAALKALGFLGGGSTREPILFYGCRERRSRRNCSGGIKNGFCWRIPPMTMIGCVRMMSITVTTKLCEVVRMRSSSPR